MTAPALSVVSMALALVGPAETAFRSRWRLGTLRKINADLHDMLVDQIALYEASLVTGTDREVQEQSGAMVRGWRAACAAVEAPLQPDDAYLVGHDYEKGIKVCISDQRHSVARVQALNGERVVMVTPDEVARMVAGLSILAAAKSVFPDAEIIEVYPQ